MFFQVVVFALTDLEANVLHARVPPATTSRFVIHGSIRVHSGLRVLEFNNVTVPFLSLRFQSRRRRLSVSPGLEKDGGVSGTSKLFSMQHLRIVGFCGG